MPFPRRSARDLLHAGAGKELSVTSFSQRKNHAEERNKTTVKYLCFGYYEKSKFDGMSESERNAMFDTCFEYDDHLRANGTGPVEKRFRGRLSPNFVPWIERQLMRNMKLA